MLNNLFGVELSYIAQFFLAFVIVLVLIAGTFWLIRRFGANRIGGDKARGRQPRLAVIDAAAVDSRRRLILIRRDNVEHLMMIGGPSDVVVEQNIVRAVPVAPAREAPPTRGPGETVARGTDMVRPEPPPRAAPAEDANWSPPALPEGIRPRAEPPSRASEPVRPLPESISPPPRMASPEPRQPLPRPNAELAPVEVRQSPPTADVNLADMAQRLEAALRRPGQPPDARAEPPPRPAPPLARPAPPPRTVPAPESVMPPIPRVTPPRPVSPPPEPPMARAAPTPSVPSPSTPPPTAPAPSAPAPSVSAPSVSAPSAPSPSLEPLRAPEPPPMQAAPPPPAAEPPRSEAPEPKPEPARPKSVFDSLEEEMASLLGRPPDKP
jgi:hypothetical protein